MKQDLLSVLRLGAARTDAETRVATAEATRTRRLFFKKNRFILSLKECLVACAAAVLSKTGRANWHDFGRCQKKINQPLIEATLGSEGGSRERAHRKFLEGKLSEQAEALEAERRRLDGELARLAKRIDKNTQTLAEALPATRDAGEPTFTAASH